MKCKGEALKTADMKFLAKTNSNIKMPMYNSFWQRQKLKTLNGLVYPL